MCTLPPARFAAVLIAMAASAPTLGWTDDQAEQSAELAPESAAQAANAEEGAGQDPSVPSGEEAPFEDSASNTTAPEPGEERRELPRGVPEAPLASTATPTAALATTSSAPPVPRVPPESPLEFSRRIGQARQLAAAQRKARTTDVVPEGLSREELEIRGGERNVAIYDKQIATGEGTPTIEAYRKYALQTLADGRRRLLTKVWADTLHHADAPRILREHARRMAELKRIRLLAEVKSFSGIVRQTEELMAKETHRFETSMHALRGGTAAKADGSNASLAQTAAAR